MTTSMEPSPGPWVWVKDIGGDLLLEDANGVVVLSADMLRDDGCRPHDERLVEAAPELLAMLKRMATPEVSRCEVNRSMVDVDRECGEQNRCEPCRAALEVEALIARLEGER